MTCADIDGRASAAVNAAQALGNGARAGKVVEHVAWRGTYRARQDFAAEEGISLSQP